MEYRFINPENPLGKASREYLRNISGYKRLPSSIIEELIFTNNLQYEEQEQIKKDKVKQLKAEKAKQLKKAQTKRKVEIFDYTQFDEVEVSQKLYDVLKKYENKIIVVDLYFGDIKKETYQYDLNDVLTGSFANIWSKFIVFDFFYPTAYYDRVDEIPENLLDKQKPAKLYIYEGKIMNKTDLKKIVQVFRDSNNSTMGSRTLRSRSRKEKQR